jgi:hypothetical protein
MKSGLPRTRTLLTLLVLASTQHVAAQVGYDWNTQDHRKKIHLQADDNSTVPQSFTWPLANKKIYNSSGTAIAEYAYNSTLEQHTFRLLGSQGTAGKRSEIRIEDSLTTSNYGTGQVRQFEGYVTFYEGVNNQSLLQIWGHEDSLKVAQFMIDGYDGGVNGQIRFTGIPGQPEKQFGSNLYGRELKINVIHRQETNTSSQGRIYVYIDGVKIVDIADNLIPTNTSPIGSNYMKFGCYGGVKAPFSNPRSVWESVSYFSGGKAPGSEEQSITSFPAIPTKQYGDAPFNPNAESNSGLPVRYRSSNIRVAEVTSDNRIKIVGRGSVTIWASQPGNSTYAPAEVVKRTFTVE